MLRLRLGRIFPVVGKPASGDLDSSFHINRAGQRGILFAPEIHLHAQRRLTGPAWVTCPPWADCYVSAEWLCWGAHTSPCRGHARIRPHRRTEFRMKSGQLAELARLRASAIHYVRPPFRVTSSIPGALYILFIISTIIQRV